jgi:hypothetical protein
MQNRRLDRLVRGPAGEQIQNGGRASRQ